MLTLSSERKLFIALMQPRSHLKDLIGCRLLVLDCQYKQMGRYSGVRIYFFRENGTSIEYLDTRNSSIVSCLDHLDKSYSPENPVFLISYDGHYSMKEVRAI